jgi:UDP-2-acetamido-3-amino-2,3-dideoxy-glucuronate N-acetyltransferase
MDSVSIHESAIVDAGAKIGKGTKIWHFTHVMGTAEIGENCVLGQNVFVGNKAKLGNNVKVQNNVSLYDGVVCEDDVFLGPSMVFTNVINPRSAVNRKEEFKKTWVKKGVSIGANATIVCGITLGEYCFIGAGAVVTKDVKPFALMVGVPARLKGWVSKSGAILEEDLVCPETGEKYILANGFLNPVE